MISQRVVIGCVPGGAVENHAIYSVFGGDAIYNSEYCLLANSSSRNDSITLRFLLYRSD